MASVDASDSRLSSRPWLPTASCRRCHKASAATAASASQRLRATSHGRAAGSLRCSASVAMGTPIVPGRPQPRRGTGTAARLEWVKQDRQGEIVRIYNVIGYGLIVVYAQACMAFAPPSLGPWAGLQIGAV